MPSHFPIEPAARSALLSALLVAAAVPACGGSAGGDAREEAEYAAYEEGDDAPARIEVDPCNLLTREEISEQLYLALPQHQRENYSTSEFDVETSEPELGTTRLCEYRFASRDSVGGGPTWHSDFTLLVLPSNAIALAEEKRKPIEGAGPEMFKESGTAAAFYVVKGGLAVSLSRFPGRSDGEAGAPDAGRVELLRRIAGRLP